MGLICSERQDVLSPPERLYAVSHPLGPGYAVGSSVEAIPVKLRAIHRLDGFAEGLNVYEGVTTVNPTFRTYSFMDFTSDKFLFSISRETAERYLPNTYRMILADIALEAH